jgi:flagellar biosynthesis GTPase FlhF
MNKTYFIAPLVALVVFVGFYTSYQSTVKQRDALRIERVEAALKAKNDADEAARKMAMADAIKSAEQRKKDREARELKDKAEKEARQVAADLRDKAFREQEKISRQVERLKKDIEVEQTAITALIAAQKEAEFERAALVEFVRKAQTNVDALQSLLGRIESRPVTPVVTVP